MKKIDIAIDAVKSKGLSERDVTSGMNGYPVPFIGTFIYDFENMEQAEDFVREFGGEIYQAHWRDGWSNCELKGAAYKEFEPSYEDYGDNYNLIDSAEGLEYEAYWFYNEEKEYFSEEEISEMGEEEKDRYQKELIRLKEKGDKLIEECKDIEWNKYSVILYCGEFYNTIYDTIKKKSMGFYHDTHYYSIGVWLNNDLME